MKGKPNYYNQAVQILHDLKKSYPSQTFGQHIAMALAEYTDIWGMTDKEMVFALNKYQTELDSNIAPDIDVDQIYKEGLNLGTILDEEEDEEDY